MLIIENVHLSHCIYAVEKLTKNKCHVIAEM